MELSGLYLVWIEIWGCWDTFSKELVVGGMIGEKEFFRNFEVDLGIGEVGK